MSTPLKKKKKQMYLHTSADGSPPRISRAYDRKFNEVWSTRMAANYYLARRWDFNQNTGWGTINVNPANPATPITSAAPGST